MAASTLSRPSRLSGNQATGEVRRVPDPAREPRSTSPRRQPGTGRAGPPSGTDDPCRRPASSPASRPECRAARRHPSEAVDGDEFAATQRDSRTSCPRTDPCRFPCGKPAGRPAATLRPRDAGRWSSISPQQGEIRRDRLGPCWEPTGRGTAGQSLRPRSSADSDGEPACRRGSVRRGSGGVTIHLRGLPGDDGRATHPRFGLAPGGVYRAVRVAPGAGALLPHRFTLACGPMLV